MLRTVTLQGAQTPRFIGPRVVTGRQRLLNARIESGPVHTGTSIKWLCFRLSFQFKDKKNVFSSVWLWLKVRIPKGPQIESYLVTHQIRKIHLPTCSIGGAAAVISVMIDFWKFINPSMPPPTHSKPLGNKASPCAPGQRLFLAFGCFRLKKSQKTPAQRRFLWLCISWSPA